MRLSILKYSWIIHLEILKVEIVWMNRWFQDVLSMNHSTTQMCWHLEVQEDLYYFYHTICKQKIIPADNQTFWEMGKRSMSIQIINLQKIIKSASSENWRRVYMLVFWIVWFFNKVITKCPKTLTLMQALSSYQNRSLQIIWSYYMPVISFKHTDALLNFFQEAHEGCCWQQMWACAQISCWSYW